jgi:fructosamine-3-kinase
MISESLREAVRELLDEPVQDVQSVSGGSINRAAKITVGGGRTLFLKWNESAPADMFPKEHQGLALLRSAESGLRIPEVLGTRTADNGTDFIVMSHIEEGSPSSGSHRQFGKQLAALHNTTVDQYGLDHDNYIGRLPQSNDRHASWVDFFIEERLQPQLRMATDAGKLTSVRQNFERLYKELPGILADEPPSLLHGDLWGGNYFFDAEGEATIYDPAVYYGNREMELAFTHLFGGFSAAFYNAYEEAYPLQPGFTDRKDIYNLYPLLVHTNLFGQSYARRVEGNVKRF